MPKNFSPKQERMYKHVLDSTGDKGIAAATVNKYRNEHGITKKRGRQAKKNNERKARG